MSQSNSLIDVGVAILGNQEVYNLIVYTALGVIGYLAKQISTRYIHADEVDRSRDALLAAAHEMYPLVVAFKNSTPDGHLTDEQRSHLQSKALERAAEIGKSAGIDVLKVLGPSIARATLEVGVKSLKSKKPELMLPPEVLERLANLPAAPQFVIPVPNPSAPVLDGNVVISGGTNNA